MDYTELFDRYMDGRLDGKELDDFRKKLDGDSEFKKRFEKFLSLHNIAEKIFEDDHVQDLEMKVDRETDLLSKQDITKYGSEKRGSPDEGIATFRKNMDSAEKDFFDDRTEGIRRNLPVHLWVAAAVLAAVIITVFFYMRQNRLTSMDLFTLYYEPYVKSQEVFEVARSSDDLYYAIKVFESGDYSRASLLFLQLSDSSELQVYASFYAGLTYIQMNKWEEALWSLKEAVKSDKTEITDDARWYLGLCHLRMDDSESAREQFTILASSKNEYTARSRRILRIMQ